MHDGRKRRRTTSSASQVSSGWTRRAAYHGSSRLDSWTLNTVYKTGHVSFFWAAQTGHSGRVTRNVICCLYKHNCGFGSRKLCSFYYRKCRKLRLPEVGMPRRKRLPRPLEHFCDQPPGSPPSDTSASVTSYVATSGPLSTRGWKWTRPAAKKSIRRYT